MENLKFEEDSTFAFFGQKFNGVQEFADMYTDGDAEEAKRVIPILLKKGSLKVLEYKTEIQKHLDQVSQEELVAQAVSMLDIEENMQKDLKAKQKRDGKLTYPGVEVVCGSYSDAMKLFTYCQNELRLKDVVINTTLDGHKIIAKDITDAELNAINRFYSGLKFTNTMHAGMQKSADTVTRSIDYAAQNVIAPAAQIGLKSVVNIFKSMAKVGAKVTSTAITATSQGIQQSKEELIQDPDVIRAANELINAKDALKRKTLGGKTASGITMLTD